MSRTTEQISDPNTFSNVSAKWYSWGKVTSTRLATSSLCEGEVGAREVRGGRCGRGRLGVGGVGGGGYGWEVWEGEVTGGMGGASPPQETLTCLCCLATTIWESHSYSTSKSHLLS